MIEIIEKSKELNKKELYKMTLDQDIEKLSDHVNSEIDVEAFVIFKDGENTITSIMDKDGRVYASNSETFRKNLTDINSVMSPDPYTIEVKSGTSKSGRTFIYCSLR